VFTWFAAKGEEGEAHACLAENVVFSIVLSLALASPALAQFDWQQAKGTQLRVLLSKPWQGRSSH
jgi:hypothetical protein